MSRAAKAKESTAPASKTRPVSPFSAYEAELIIDGMTKAIGMPEQEIEVLGNYFSAWFQWMEHVGGSLEVGSKEIDALHCFMGGLQGRVALLRQLPHTAARLREIAAKEGGAS